MLMNQKEQQVPLLDRLRVNGSIALYHIPSRFPSDPESDIVDDFIPPVDEPRDVVDDDALVGIIGVTNWKLSAIASYSKTST